MRAVGPPFTRARAMLTAAVLKYGTRRATRRGGLAAGSAFAIRRAPKARDGLRVWCSREGFEWCLDLTDVAQRLLYATGSYERPLVRLIADRLGPDDLVLDIGAHVGLLTVPIARHLDGLNGQGRVVSFEPSPDSAASLQANIDANDLGARASVVRAGVGATAGVLELRTTTGYGDSSSTRSVHGSGPVVATAPRIAIDEWWREHGEPAVGLVKVDVEGAEYDVLVGMQEMLRQARPHTLVVECKPDLALQGAATSADTVELLRGLGYALEPPVSEQRGLPESSRHVDDNLVFRRVLTD